MGKLFHELAAEKFGITVELLHESDEDYMPPLGASGDWPYMLSCTMKTGDDFEDEIGVQTYHKSPPDDERKDSDVMSLLTNFARFLRKG